MSLREEEEWLGKRGENLAFDLGEFRDLTVVHPHESSVSPWMAVGLGQCTGSRGANMSEDEGRFDLFGDALKVLIIPCWSDRGEDAGSIAQLWILFGVVPAHAEAVAVDSARGIETQPRVKSLVDDRVGGACNEMAKLNRVGALEN